MKAAVVTGYGAPERVQVADVGKPEPRDNELLVKVHATTVNRTDSSILGAEPYLIKLFYGLSRPRVRVLGNEFAGEVEAVGSGVTSFQVGDRVFGFNTGLTGGRGQFGAQAEYMVVREDGALATMPADLTYEEAAPCMEGPHYALSMVRSTKIQRGQDVLVNGATGAIGSAAVQLCRNLGARVVATCPTEQMELVRGLGAERVIDYTAQDFTEDDQRYDVVCDAVGKSTFGRCRHLLKPRGIYTTSDGRPWLQYLALLLVTPLLGGKRVVFALPRTSPSTAAHLKELIEAGELRPVIDRRYPLAQIAEAYRYVASGRKVGTVVINVHGTRAQG
jgi:NADPH:quinone reductase-like Zn-dependent oxidoreductase